MTEILPVPTHKVPTEPLKETISSKLHIPQLSQAELKARLGSEHNDQFTEGPTDTDRLLGSR